MLHIIDNCRLFLRIMFWHVCCNIVSGTLTLNLLTLISLRLLWFSLSYVCYHIFSISLKIKNQDGTAVRYLLQYYSSSLLKGTLKRTSNLA